MSRYKRYYERNKDKHRKRYLDNKEHFYWNALKAKYGVTQEHYESMLEEQQHCCAICKTHVDELPKRLYVDHCHETNQVRGLLCNDCNRGLGCFRDNIQSILDAAKYLST